MLLNQILINYMLIMGGVMETAQGPMSDSLQAAGQKERESVRMAQDGAVLADAPATPDAQQPASLSLRDAFLKVVAGSAHPTMPPLSPDGAPPAWQAPSLIDPVLRHNLDQDRRLEAGFMNVLGGSVGEKLDSVNKTGNPIMSMSPDLGAPQMLGAGYKHNGIEAAGGTFDLAAHAGYSLKDGMALDARADYTATTTNDWELQGRLQGVVLPEQGKAMAQASFLASRDFQGSDHRPDMRLTGGASLSASFNAAHDDTQVNAGAFAEIHTRLTTDRSGSDWKSNLSAVFGAQAGTQQVGAYAGLLYDLPDSTPVLQGASVGPSISVTKEPGGAQNTTVGVMFRKTLGR